MYYFDTHLYTHIHEVKLRFVSYIYTCLYIHTIYIYTLYANPHPPPFSLFLSVPYTIYASNNHI